MKYGIKALMAAGVLVFAVGAQGALAARQRQIGGNQRACPGVLFGESESGTRRGRQRGDQSQH